MSPSDPPSIITSKQEYSALTIQKIVDTLNSTQKSSPNLNTFASYLLSISFTTQAAEDISKIAEVFTCYANSSTGFVVNGPRLAGYVVNASSTNLDSVLTKMATAPFYPVSKTFSALITDAKSFTASFFPIVDSPALPFTNSQQILSFLYLYTTYTPGAVGTAGSPITISLKDSATSLSSTLLSLIPKAYTPIHWGGFVTTDGYMGASFGNAAIHDVMDPLTAQDAATKKYVDTNVSYVNQSLAVHEKQIAQLYSYFFVSNPNTTLVPNPPPLPLLVDIQMPELADGSV